MAYQLLFCLYDIKNICNILLDVVCNTTEAAYLSLINYNSKKKMAFQLYVSQYYTSFNMAIFMFNCKTFVRLYFSFFIIFRVINF